MHVLKNLTYEAILLTFFCMKQIYFKKKSENILSKAIQFTVFFPLNNPKSLARQQTPSIQFHKSILPRMSN